MVLDLYLYIIGDTWVYKPVGSVTATTPASWWGMFNMFTVTFFTALGQAAPPPEPVPCPTVSPGLSAPIVICRTSGDNPIACCIIIRINPDHAGSAWRRRYAPWPVSCCHSCWGRKSLAIGCYCIHHITLCIFYIISLGSTGLWISCGNS